jgi:hypothetical protein
MSFAKSLRQYATPRKVAWALVLSGTAWFVYVSPKTPLEFFDAATRDAEELEEREMQKYESIDPEAAVAVRALNEIMWYGRHMDRLALIHDLASNPMRVQTQKHWIIDGGYSLDKDAAEALKESDDQYRDLAKAIATSRTNHKRYMSNEALRNKVIEMRNIAAKDKRFKAATMEMGMDRQLLREFQARLFWWGGC